MKITFYGAAREVTGSCYLVESKQARILVDCGMFQGYRMADAKNFADLPFDPKSIDAVFLTHAHLDHSGRLPVLCRQGFRGPIYATPPTTKLASLVLEDAFHVMKDDFKREYRPMLYEEEDIQNALKQFTGVEYGKETKIKDLTVVGKDAGHIFGSAFFEVREKGGGSAAFSGDLGNAGAHVLRETSPLGAVDALMIESTYGNRIHEDAKTRETLLRESIETVIKQKGVLIIPAFAIERTQQLLFELNDLVEHKKIPPVDMYLDSPLAIRATDVIKQYPQYYDQEAMALVSKGDDFFDFPGLKATLSRDESKLINDSPKPKVIIAGSGMMNGGRILHHLVRYLGDPSTIVLVVGYQAEGTLGRLLYNGAKSVEIHGEHIQVKAKIQGIGAYSAHADQNKLVAWVKNAASLPKHVYCIHGDEGAAVSLATRLKNDLGLAADAPHFGDSINV